MTHDLQYAFSLGNNPPFRLDSWVRKEGGVVDNQGQKANYDDASYTTASI